MYNKKCICSMQDNGSSIPTKTKLNITQLDYTELAIKCGTQQLTTNKQSNTSKSTNKPERLNMHAILVSLSKPGAQRNATNRVEAKQGKASMRRHIWGGTIWWPGIMVIGCMPWMLAAANIGGGLVTICIGWGAPIPSETGRVMYCCAICPPVIQVGAIVLVLRSQNKK